MVRGDGATDPTLAAAAASDTALEGATDDDAATPRRQGDGASYVVPGYHLGDLLGRGGMGEVLLAHDPKIGRDVAVKRMRMAEPSADAIARFWREAKIQARLDHPAIVPVHELGHDAGGQPYFTMKRLAGTTLQDVLAHGRDSQQKLLRTFIDVCLAIEFAHVRRVVHRDLKPSNIMLGDYGEVYVLDWGIARVLGDTANPDAISDIPSLDGHTQVGAMLGTPGFMAPEQVRGDAEVGTAADVYALGAILFEILAGESLHPSGAAAIASTLTTPTAAPAQRASDRQIAPELDAACTAALVEVALARPTARELGERVQRYLDGDRDVAARRAFAADQLALAHEAAADPARRIEAMRVAGRALAIDHQSVEAAQLVTRLLLEPPVAEPPELAARLRAVDDEYTTKSARLSVYALLCFFTFLPVLAWNGVKSWGLVAAAFVVIAALVAYVFVYARRGGVTLVPTLIGNCIVGAMLGRLFGPFVFIPPTMAIVIFGMAAQPEFVERPFVVIGGGIAALVVPIVLEATGVISSTWSLSNGGLEIHSDAIAIGGAPTATLLIAGTIATMIVAGLFSRGLARSRRDAHRRLEIHAWHLAQMLPVETPPAPSPAPASSCHDRP